jgi:translation initiation factor 3 subunit I
VHFAWLSGTNLATIETKSAVRSCGFSYSAQQFFFTTDATMGQKSELRVYNVNDVKTGGASAAPYLTIPSDASKITSCVWGPCDDTFITGHKNGDLVVWDAETGEELIRDTQSHQMDINDIQYNKDMTFLITASKDTKARLFDVANLEPVKLYKTERPVNSACISPLKDQVLLGGGQDAMSVTTTGSKVGKFEATFWHSIFEEEIGRVKGHFGPINTLAFQPNGRGYASGGEDGYIRVHNFDDSYFEFEYE